MPEKPLLTCLPSSILQAMNRSGAEGVQISNKLTWTVGTYSHKQGVLVALYRTSAGCSGSLRSDLLKAVLKWHIQKVLVWAWQCFLLIPTWRRKKLSNCWCLWNYRPWCSVSWMWAYRLFLKRNMQLGDGSVSGMMNFSWEKNWKPI